MTNWQNRIQRHGVQAADQFLANPRNPRKHPKKQRDAVHGSLNKLGWIAPVIVNARTGYMIDGHERVWQALQNNNADVPYIEVDLSPDEEALALATFDWITYYAEYDRDNLDALLREVNTDDAALQTVIAELAESVDLYTDDVVIAEDEGAQLDKAEELREKWQTERGQLWVISSAQGGEHRLLCGDSTNADDVARLMAGEKAFLTLTDPPYGVKMDKGFGGFGGFGKPIARRVYADEWDDDRPVKSTFDLILKQSEFSIVWGGNFFADLLPQSTHWIVWDKLNTMPTFGDCELAWTSIERKSVKKYTVEYNGLIGKEKDRFHPTQKPVQLIASVMGDYSDKGQLVFDPFGGSGTTMVACEQLGRQCRMIEIEPKYVAVILERMAALGLTPQLVNEHG